MKYPPRAPPSKYVISPSLRTSWSSAKEEELVEEQGSSSKERCSGELLPGLDRGNRTAPFPEVSIYRHDQIFYLNEKKILPERL